MQLSRFHFSILAALAGATLVAYPMVVRSDFSLTTTDKVPLPDTKSPGLIGVLNDLGIGSSNVCK